MIKTQQETILFNEFLNRLCNVYDSVKHLNPPKEMVITGVINEMRTGVFKITARKGITLDPEFDEKRLRDYKSGLTDRELSQLWGLSVSAVRCWRQSKRLKPNARVRNGTA
jgi:phage gp16-like protein